MNQTLGYPTTIVSTGNTYDLGSYPVTLGAVSSCVADSSGGSGTTTPSYSSYGYCDTNTHRFECRHATSCQCGAATRIAPASLDVPAGL